MRKFINLAILWLMIDNFSNILDTIELNNVIYQLMGAIK